MFNFKKLLNGKAANVAVFSYGAVVGTTAPLILSRCGSNCSSCAGACGLALSILPLVGFIVAKNRLKKGKVNPSMGQDMENR